MGLMQSRMEWSTEEANEQVADIRWWLSQRLYLLDPADLPDNREHFLKVCVRELCWQIQVFNRECRFLVMLADVGRFVGHISRTIETILDLLEIREPRLREFWHQQFQEERNRLMEHYDGLLRNEMVSMLAMGNRHHQLEVLTLMKFGLNKYENILTEREKLVISRTYAKIARLSSLGDVDVPSWFCGKGRAVVIGNTEIKEGEDECVKQATIWSKLNHPNVLRFYNACHVGVPFIRHDESVKWKDFMGIKMEPSWNIILGWALGLQYLHECGLKYRKLSGSALHILPSTRQGVVSGLRLQEYTHNSRRNNDLDSETKSEEDQPSAIAEEISMFGYLVYDFLVTHRFSEYGSIIYNVIADYRTVSFMPPSLPADKPFCLSEEEWELLVGMCTSKFTMAEIVYRLGELSKKDTDQEAQSEATTSLAVMLTQALRDYAVPPENQQLEQIFQDARELCERVSEFGTINGAVLDRLDDVYQQLQTRQALDYPVPLASVEELAQILVRFVKRLDNQWDGDYDMSLSIAGSLSLANRHYALHHCIDRLINKYSQYLQLNEAHNWRSIWAHEQQSLQNHQIIAATTLPPWFLPPNQVDLGAEISSGGFADTFHAKWFDTEVVVKKLRLTGQNSYSLQRNFEHEVNVWFRLHHPNIIKLFGACHVGGCFFVCERATNGTLRDFLDGNEDHRHGVWHMLVSAAEGLNYLHENGIIHGDLKGDNILVCEPSISGDFIKLSDFGLSNFTDPNNANADIVASAAIPWQASEILKSGRPTTASDIYAFGMCIIEVVTRSYPWGQLDRSALKDNVINGRLPARPSEFTDEQWRLVERMCCFNPDERICSGAVLEMLQRLSWRDVDLEGDGM